MRRARENVDFIPRRNSARYWYANSIGDFFDDCKRIALKLQIGKDDDTKESEYQKSNLICVFIVFIHNINRHGFRRTCVELEKMWTSFLCHFIYVCTWVIGNSVPWKHYRQTTLYEVQSRKTVFVSIYCMNYEYARKQT
jgi:hypothetical protein